MATQIHVEGKQYLLEVAFSEEQSVPASFYLGLIKDTSLQVDDTLDDFTESDTAGYERQAIASDDTDFTSAVDGTGWKVTALAQTFTFSAGGDDVSMWFLATSIDETGKLIASGTLDAAPVTPSASDTVQVTPTISEP